MNSPEFVEAIINEMKVCFLEERGWYHQRYCKSLDEIAEQISGGKWLHDRLNDFIVGSYNGYLAGNISTHQFVTGLQDFLFEFQGDDENTIVDRTSGGLEDVVEAITYPLMEDFQGYSLEKTDLVNKIALLFGKPDLAESLKFISDVDLVLLGRIPIRPFVEVMIAFVTYGVRGLL